MSETAVSPSGTSPGPRAPPQPCAATEEASVEPAGCPWWGRCCCFVWDLVVRGGSSSRSCCRRRSTRWRAGDRPRRRTAARSTSPVTVKRTLDAFAIAAVIGVPLGVVLGSNERAYRSVEFLIDFFRSTPSSALIPLFLLIFGVSDINKVAIAAFGALLIVLFNSAYGVMNASKQRMMAAKVMGAIALADLQATCWYGRSLQPTFVGPAQRGVDGAGDRDRGRDVHRLGQRPRPPHHRCAAGAEREEHVRGDSRRRRTRLCAQRALPAPSSGASCTGAEDEAHAPSSKPPVARPTCRRLPSFPGPCGHRRSRFAASPSTSPGWPLYENFDLDIPKHKIVSVFGPTAAASPR